MTALGALSLVVSLIMLLASIRLLGVRNVPVGRLSLGMTLLFVSTNLMNVSGGATDTVTRLLFL